MQGKVFRVEKNKNYTVISNFHLKDKNLSLKAKGLLSLMLSLPDDWDYSINGLVAICKEELRAVKSTLEELKQYGYLKVVKMPPQKGKNCFSYEYTIYEQPQNEDIQNVDVQSVDIQNVHLQDVPIQNALQLNINKSNINELNTKKTITKDNKDIYIVDFENFYSLYPRKEAKQKALQAYLKAIKKVDKDTLLEGLKKYIDYIKTNKKEREFIKHHATWLNQGCWEDEYSKIAQFADKNSLIRLIKEA